MIKKIALFSKFPILLWLLLSIPIAVAVGSMVALFLYTLEQVTYYRETHNWLLYLLPIAGVFIYFLYERFGKSIIGGNNVVIKEAQHSKEEISLLMAPIILCTTLVTHLFGGSAGREGTAVQIGGSIANGFAYKLGLQENNIKIITTMGIAAGFAAVFGTSVAAAVFAIEVLVVGKLFTKAFLPSLAVAFLADYVCKKWGITHTHYTIVSSIKYNPTLIIKVFFASILFGLVAQLFVYVSEVIKQKANQIILQKWFIPFLGGVIIIVSTWLLGTTDYLGLGVNSKTPNAVTILSCFKEGGATYFSWFWKLLFTAITLSLGFKGGEVTPLFFIGAALGNTIAIICNAPVDLFAALGFVALFASATNTPIACSIMAVELFGVNAFPYFVFACFIAYYCNGNKSIYTAQLIKNKQ